MLPTRHPGRQTVRSSTRVPRTRAAPGRLVNVARLGPPPKRGFLLTWVRDPARSCLRACLCLPLPPWLVLAAGIRLLNFHKGKRQQSTMTKDNLANCSGRTTTYSRETFYSTSEITIPGSRESGARTAPASPRCATGADLSSGSVVVRVRAACPSYALLPARARQVCQQGAAERNGTQKNTRTRLKTRCATNARLTLY